MGKNATPISFNTIKHSNRKARLARQARGRVVLLAMCVVVLAILLSLAVFLFCSIADTLNSKRPPDEDETDNTGTPAVGAVTYMQVTRPNSAVHAGELIAVNKEHAYAFPASEAELLNIYDNRTKVNGSNPYQIGMREWKMNKTAFAAFDAMMAKYYEISGDASTQITSAYRTYEDQNKLNSSIDAGYSDHHTGYCVTLQKATTSSNGSREKLESDHWIYQNAHKYGFIVRYPDSKVDVTGVSDYNYCFRYVGVAHASYINANGLALEEYLTLLKTDYAGNTHLKIDAADGNRYEVYYVATANGELTTVSVPENFAYTVSGDNIGGFVVTVNLSAPLA